MSFVPEQPADSQGDSLASDAPKSDVESDTVSNTASGDASDAVASPPSQTNDEASQPPAAKSAPSQAVPEKSTSKIRLTIGSMRRDDTAKTAKPKPINPVERLPGSEAAEAHVEARHYPPPNLRDKLSPEMERELKAALGGDSLEDLLEDKSTDDSKTPLENESRRKARVISVHREDVFVELGGRDQGIVPLRNFAEPPEPGAVVEVVVNRFNAEDGLYEVNLPGAAVDVADWSAMEEGMVVEATVTGHNKGGLECTVGKLRGFMPVSQVSLYRVEELEEFVGQKFSAVVTEANAERRNLVLSRRAVLEREKEELRKKLLETLAVGQEFEGTVTTLKDFGAFVDIGGVDGLIHISKLSWERIQHPSEVLEVGQTVNVTVEKHDPVSGKISLEYRDRTESPWTSAAENYPATTIAKGKVSKVMDFGAFVRLKAGVEGLIHISELSHRRVHRVSDVVSEGQDVEVQVLSIDADAQRMSLSMKALEARPEAAPSTTNQDELDAAAEPRTPKVSPDQLQGGLGGDAGGDQFGLKW